jgi:peptidoglycan/LPS O-acetylase OafA/YrhL
MHIRIDKEHMPMRKYFLRRFFRIAPAYYFVLSITFFLYGAGFPRYSNPQDETLTWLDYGAHLIFVNGFFPYYSSDFIGVEWSVSTEFMFYMLLPFIFLWLNKTSTANQAINKIGFLYLASIALYWVFFFKGEVLHGLGNGFDTQLFDAWNYFFIATHLQAFVVGVAMWLIIHLQSRDLPMIVNRQQAKFALAGLVCAAIAGAYVEAYNLNDPGIVWSALIFWGLLSGALIYVLDILRPAKRFGLGWLTELGRVSFSLYLVHFPVCYGLSHSTKAWHITQVLEVNFLMYEIVVLGLSYFLARLLFRFVENPGMNLGRVLIGRFSTP